MLEDIKRAVCEANKRLRAGGLVILTEGNASQISSDRKYMVIKPSGVPYDDLTPERMVVVMMDGTVTEGNDRPSSDTPTHLEIYKKFPAVGGIVHTHSPYAAIFAQMKLSIPCYGTTHADAFYGDIPVTRLLTDDEIKSGYEKNTGTAIAEVLDFPRVSCVLVAHHGPFAFGASAEEAADNAHILEKVACMAHRMMASEKGKNFEKIPQNLLDKHFFRKHGSGRYYGQG